jgi:hypothetical protein
MKIIKLIIAKQNSLNKETTTNRYYNGFGQLA